MTFLVQTNVLVDATSAEAAEEIVLQAILPKRHRGIYDAITLDSRAVVHIIDDAIANDTYSEGDAFKSLIIFNNERARTCSDGFLSAQAFWSESYGWTSYDLATRFDSTHTDLPDGGVALIDHGPEYFNSVPRDAFASDALHEYLVNVLDDGESTPFICKAEDAEHAREQAVNAYPLGIVKCAPTRVDLWPLATRFVSFSLSEASAMLEDGCEGVPGYWSNVEGWVTLDEATYFTEVEMASFDLPMSKGMDATWLPIVPSRALNS